MTIISILGGDFEILFDDETAGGVAVKGLKMVRRAAGATSTVYTTQQLYSAVAEVTDDFIAMGFENPMLPTTPNAFTMENNYFIPRSSTEFLRTGAISADWTFASGEGVIMKSYVAVSAAFVSGDIGREIVEIDTGDTGTLLDFETLPDNTTVVWIRPEAAGDTFVDVDSQLEVTSDGGTGDVTTGGNHAAAISGNTLFAAVQAIGSVPTATEVYLVQDRFKMTDSAGNFQWWATNTAVSLEIISILIRIQNATDSATFIAAGDVEVFARRYTSLYDNFRLNVSNGGFSALPLASGPDINNITGFRSNTTTSSSGTFNVGNAVYVSGTDFAAATMKGVITAVTGSNPTVTIEYYLIGDLNDLSSSEALKEFDFVADADGDALATADASGSVFNPGGPTDAGAAEGGSVTFTLGVIELDHDGDGLVESYSVDIDAQGDVPIAKVYERIKFELRRGATTDLFSGMNVPGETYRGLEGTFEYTAATSLLTEGDDVSIVARGGFSARLMAQNDNPTDPGEVTHITLTDIQNSLAASQPVLADVIIDEGGGQDVTLGTTGFGIERFTSPKSSPFGTFTGSQIFGARGILFSSPASVDTQAYILTDNLGTLRNPPNTVAFTVTNTRAGDRILVARDTAGDGVIDKDQFGGMAATVASLKILTVAGSIDSEVAQAGFVRVVETNLQQEHHYVYDTTADPIFNLRDITASTADDSGATTTPTLLNDSGAAFQTEGVEPGMLIQDTTNTDTYEVVTLVSGFEETRITIVQIFGTGGSLASGDDYTINETIQTYDTNDNIYDLIIDEEEDVGTGGTPGSASNTFVKLLAADFDVVVNVRQGKSILPFTQNVTIGDGGASATVVRSPDTIAI